MRSAIGRARSLYFALREGIAIADPGMIRAALAGLSFVARYSRDRRVATLHAMGARLAALVGGEGR